MIFVANYKMKGDKSFYKKANELIDKLESKDTVVLCPPFVYMPFFELKNKSVFLGSQDISDVEDKKSTGQINARMLKEFNVNYAIIGHSERRAIGENDEIVAKKVGMAQENNIVPIVCVGEKTKLSKLDVLKKQVKTALSKAVNKKIMFAYEPIWAIGSGEIPTIEKINKALNLIKEEAKENGFCVKVLYGGSVNLSNHKELRTTVADGFLMGGVSLKLDDFCSIVKGE